MRNTLGAAGFLEGPAGPFGYCTMRSAKPGKSS